jgi:hypothetical protein
MPCHASRITNKVNSQLEESKILEINLGEAMNIAKECEPSEG